MKEQRFRNDWLKAFEKLKSSILAKFEEDDFRHFEKVISKLATYHYNKKKYIILGLDRKLYNFLIENSYNPYTVYRWFLLERIPEDVKFQLKNGMLNQKLASKITFKRRHESKSKVCIDIKLMGINHVRSM